MPEAVFGQLWTLPEHFSVKVVPVQCSPRVPTAGRDFCHPRRLCPVWQSHIEARGHQAHHRGTSALISDGHYPEHVCTLLHTNQTQQLLQADNPELSLYRGQTQPGRAPFLRSARLSGEEWEHVRVRAVDAQGWCPLSWGTLQESSPIGGSAGARAAAAALSNCLVGHPSSLRHPWLLTDTCVPCENRCEVFFWLLQWLAFLCSTGFLPCLLQIKWTIENHVKSWRCLMLLGHHSQTHFFVRCVQIIIFYPFPFNSWDS